MSLYTKDSIERVKDAVDMVALVGARSDLRRVGTRWTGLCPFHDERTPSFSVNAEHKLYHCFGCGESGDAIGFVQATEALDFRAAIEFLADRYGIELQREEEDPLAEERRKRRERLLKLVERTAAYYARYLWESAEAARARDYLAGRGLGEEVLRAFRIGYAPSAWDRVSGAAQRDGFRPEELAAAGLAQRGRQGGFYDRFRGRIMFPLADARGRVLGFGARSVREDQQPKYLNTSENELYHKGRQLFGIDHARAAAAKKGRIVAVEGYTDVLALHQGGIPESVAIMGTALTQEQLAELSRAAGTLHLALDADSSGQEAMLRAARGARERQVELRVVGMPEGTDPADLVAADGAEAFERLIASAVTVPEFEVRRALSSADLDAPAGRDRALGEILPIIHSVPANSVLRDHLVRIAADKIDVPLENLQAQLASAPAPAPPARRDGANGNAASAGSDGAPARVASPTIEAVARSERAFLAMCLSEPGEGREYLERLEDDHFSSDALRRVRDHLLDHFEDPLAELPADDPSLAALVTEVAMRGQEERASAEGLRLTFLQLELQRVERQLRHAARDEDFERQRALWPARESIRAQIDELMGQSE
ncbi:MAG: primase [Thermoleophilaceae bacterium]|jgi:DNA primase|nr:primase [Thermoleophilaceae bacterium]